MLTVKEFNEKFPVGSPVKHEGVQQDTTFLTVVQEPAFFIKNKGFFINSRMDLVELEKVVTEWQH